MGPIAQLVEHRVCNAGVWGSNPHRSTSIDINKILSSTFMLLSTHLAAGLIISKLTGNYNVSLLGSVVMDLDHLIAYYRTGILLKFKKVLIATTGGNYIGLPQRNFFHNIFFCLLVLAIVSVINFSTGLTFGAAYVCHLILDALDNKNYYPFYPSLKINLRGPIKYFSRQEFIFTFILLLIFFII